MLRVCLFGAVTALLTATAARPQTGARWPGLAGGLTSGSITPDAFTRQFMAPQPETGGFRPLTSSRQGRHIAAGTATNQLAATTTTARPNAEKKLVTLRPIGKNIQEILYNNNYRKAPGEHEPEPNNIDDFSQLGGLQPSEVWLLDDDLLVLKGGKLTESFTDTTPIDDYQAPYRVPKFPPPGFNPDRLLPQDTAGSTFPGGRGQRQPKAFVPEFAYDPFGSSRAGPARQTTDDPRRLLLPAGFQVPAAGDVPRHTHQRVTYVKGRPFPGRQPTGYIHNNDGLPRSFSTSNSYPAAAVVSSGRQQRPAPVAQPYGSFSVPTTTVYDTKGNFMTYTDHEGGYSYSYKTDGKAR